MNWDIVEDIWSKKSVIGVFFILKLIWCKLNMPFNNRYSWIFEFVHYVGFFSCRALKRAFVIVVLDFSIQTFHFEKKFAESLYIVIIYKFKVILCVPFKVILKWLLQVIILPVVLLSCCNGIGNIFDDKFLSHFYFFFHFCYFNVFLIQAKSVFRELTSGLAVQSNYMLFLGRLIWLILFIYITVF